MDWCHRFFGKQILESGEVLTATATREISLDQTNKFGTNGLQESSCREGSPGLPPLQYRHYGQLLTTVAHLTEVRVLLHTNFVKASLPMHPRLYITCTSTIHQIRFPPSCPYQCQYQA